eukprot:m.202545 g.202545  ORF g.202545 m.202545 type:complete len:159 (+) comp15365_c2_seq1:828-1304(+)
MPVVEHLESCDCVTVGPNLMMLRVRNLVDKVKKWQYVGYKHALLHGLTFSLAVNVESSKGVGNSRPFRLYWLLLNTGFVTEFFMQSLVKAKLLSQGGMMWLQVLLMGTGTVAAVRVLFHVRPSIAIVSLALNFGNRGHEMLNCGIVCLFALAMQHSWL